MRFPREKVWQGKPFIGTRANGGFTTTEVKTPGLEFRNHAVHVRTDGTVQLAADGLRIDGFFVLFDGGDLVVYRDTTKGQWARNGTTSVIPAGSRVVGAEKSGVPSDKPTHGYVKPVDLTVLAEVVNALNNIVRAPAGAAHTASAYPPADVIVEIGIASSD